jgi:palmitoyltransferase
MMARTFNDWCCGIIIETKHKAMERAAARTKQPWIVLKLAVGITLGLIGYASYVYVGRLCVPMIREDDSALGGRTLGSESTIRCVCASVT